VLINRPFAHASLFSKVKGKELPARTAEFDCKSRAQLFLKYLLAHPAIIGAIPGTRRVEHLKDNMQAGLGRLPDAVTRRRMVEYLKRL
jgi:aryl-alcohol dehydrogenase-like predicted oxidoreductase